MIPPLVEKQSLWYACRMQSFTSRPLPPLGVFIQPQLMAAVGMFLQFRWRQLRFDDFVAIAFVICNGLLGCVCVVWGGMSPRRPVACGVQEQQQSPVDTDYTLWQQSTVLAAGYKQMSYSASPPASHSCCYSPRWHDIALA